MDRARDSTLAAFGRVEPWESNADRKLTLETDVKSYLGDPHGPEKPVNDEEFVGYLHSKIGPRAGLECIHARSYPD